MKNYYRELKPFLNKLSYYNVFDNLFVIRQYMIAFGDNKPYKKLFDIEKSDSNIIMPNYSDFLTAVSIIYSSELPQCKYSLRDHNNRGVLVKFLRDFSHKVDMGSINKEVFCG